MSPAEKRDGPIPEVLWRRACARRAQLALLTARQERPALLSACVTFLRSFFNTRYPVVEAEAREVRPRDDRGDRQLTRPRRAHRSGRHVSTRVC